MKIHEYQAKEILANFGVSVPAGICAADPAAAAVAFQELGVTAAVVKAQIHAGGRGKAGGVKVVRSAEEARAAAAGMLGRALVTHQTGPEGRTVRKVLVEAGSAIASERYLAVAVDRSVGAPVIIASAEGGMDIEELAQRRPEAILREVLHPLKGLLPFQARRLGIGLGFRGPQLKAAISVITRLCRVFTELDCALAEINPLIETAGGEVLALDAKIDFDGNALFRHRELADLRDPHESDPKEIEASKHGLSYIALDGSIGCMVNGAGLAMATMDVIQREGGSPANFLDVGGGANEAQVTHAFRILLSDRNVKGVLVNIFGGIMKCDTIAAGVIAAAREVSLSVPLVVRLEGTNVEAGRALLERSGLALQTAASLDEAAAKIVALVGGPR